MQTAAHSAELNALKLAAEHASVLQYYLRDMEVKADAPATMLCDDKAAATNAAATGSALSKNHLALACHFCRECFSTEAPGT